MGLFSFKVFRRRLTVLFHKRAQECGVGVEARQGCHIVHRVTPLNVPIVEQLFSLLKPEVVDIFIKGLLLLAVDVVA